MKFKTILIDPPWPHAAGRANIDKANERFIKVSSIDILTLPIDDLAEKQAHLYIWVTNFRQTEEIAIKMMTNAGFIYKSCIIWVKITQTGKPSMAFGGYFRHSYEKLLFGVRGKLAGGTRSLPNVILAQRQGLAVKPDKSYEFINAMSPEPRLEIFARRKMPGWYVWGNGVKSDIKLKWHGNRVISSQWYKY